jgi:hypothetical protein
VARMLYTARTADVVSKTAAGEWLANARPKHADTVTAALAARHATTPAGAQSRELTAATAALMGDVVRLVAG